MLFELVNPLPQIKLCIFKKKKKKKKKKKQLNQTLIRVTFLSSKRIINLFFPTKISPIYKSTGLYNYYMPGRKQDTCPGGSGLTCCGRVRVKKRGKITITCQLCKGLLPPQSLQFYRCRHCSHFKGYTAARKGFFLSDSPKSFRKA